jgi:CarboxypepD_reg-like domain/TonB-dependent Receptor Plug Domain
MDNLLAVVIAAWLFAGQSAGAQSASGAIAGSTVDARTGLALPRVLVVEQGTGKAVQTDDRGRFELRDVPAGTRRLFVSVVGYALVQRDVIVPAGATLDLTIPLSEGTGTYTTTVTVAADVFRAAERTVAAQQTLGSADIQNLRGVLADDPLRAVQVLPGVATGDDLKSEFSVRGSDFTHMNLTVDGFSTPYVLHTVRAIEDRAATGSVAMINSDVLEEVTLLNGGYAERFGNRTGAEVDFRLRSGSRERTQARIAVSGTSASFVAEGPLGRARRGSWIASARQSYLDLITNHIHEGLQFGFSDAQAKGGYDITPSQRVELTLIAGRSRLEQPPDVGVNDLFVGRHGSAIAIAGWRLVRPHALVAARTLTAYNVFKNDTIEGVNLDHGHDTQIAGRVDVTLMPARSLEVQTGASVESTDESRMRQRFNTTLGRYRVINDYHDRATLGGAYLALQWTAGPLTLTPGGRADRWGLTGETTASPWLQGQLQTSPSTAVRGGAGIYRQFPEFEKVIGSLGHSTAASERATQYDLGFEHRLGPSTRWQITLYDREEAGMFHRPGADTRLVGGRVVRGSTSAPYEASLDGYARGVELLLQRKGPTGLSGWISYAYGRAHYDDRLTGESFWSDLDQRHTLNLYGSYRLSDRASVSGRLRAGSNIPAPGYFRQEGDAFFVSDVRNAVRLPTYSRLDLRANRTYNWSRTRLTLFAEVINVLNRGNVRYKPPGVNTRTGQITGLYEPLVPVLPSAGILIEF